MQEIVQEQRCGTLIRLVGAGQIVNVLLSAPNIPVRSCISTLHQQFQADLTKRKTIKSLV
jgi:hypothetical protein